jgi:hypothetical protein
MNSLAIDGWCSPLDPIKRSEAVVISRIRIGAVREQNVDRFHEARLGGVVQCRGMPAVVSLPGEAPVVDTRAVTQQRHDKVGVILAPLVAGAREPDPRPRSIDARTCAREDRRQLGMKNPAAGADRCRVRSLVEQHDKHCYTLSRHGCLHRTRAAEQRLIGPRDV